MTALQLAEKQTEDLSSYLLLPENKYHPAIAVSGEKAYHGMNWYKTHEALHEEGSFMLNPRQFIDFLNLLKKGRRVYDGTGNKADSSRVRAVLDEITEKRDPWRAEWLDAYFAEIDGEMRMLYDHRTINGRLTATRAEPLEKCVMEDGYVDLGSANRQGLPTRKSGSQEIYFRYPRDGAVAGFRAGSGRVVLDCDGVSRVSDSALGSRPAKFSHRK